MKERPIIFSGPMVRALLDGSKTQTRRVVKPQPYIDEQGNFCWNGGNFGQDGKGPHTQAIASPIPSSKTKRVHCPYGKPGDRLWLRETCRAEELPDGLDGVRYLADNGFASIQPNEEGINRWLEMRAYGKRPSPVARVKTVPAIHMPRWASRITLEVTGVRVERLQDISEADAIAEGCGMLKPFSDHWQHRDVAKEEYRCLWETLHPRMGETWGHNPWVWVVEFKRISGDPK